MKNALEKSVSEEFVDQEPLRRILDESSMSYESQLNQEKDVKIEQIEEKDRILDESSMSYESQLNQEKDVKIEQIEEKDRILDESSISSESQLNPEKNVKIEQTEEKDLQIEKIEKKEEIEDGEIRDSNSNPVNRAFNDFLSKESNQMSSSELYAISRRGLERSLQKFFNRGNSKKSQKLEKSNQSSNRNISNQSSNRNIEESVIQPDNNENSNRKMMKLSSSSKQFLEMSQNGLRERLNELSRKKIKTEQEIIEQDSKKEDQNSNSNNNSNSMDRQ